MYEKMCGWINWNDLLTSFFVNNIHLKMISILCIYDQCHIQDTENKYINRNLSWNVHKIEVMFVWA